MHTQNTSVSKELLHERNILTPTVTLSVAHPLRLHLLLLPQRRNLKNRYRSYHRNRHLRQHRHHQIRRRITLDSVPGHVRRDDENQRVDNANRQNRHADGHAHQQPMLQQREILSAQPKGHEGPHLPEVDDEEDGDSGTAVRGWEQLVVLFLLHGDEAADGDANINPGNDLGDDE